MGCAEEAAGNLSVAESHIRNAYEIMLKAHGPYHEDVAWAMDHLGGVLLSLDKIDAARKELETAADILDQLGDTSFPRVSVSSNLAIALAKAGESDRAFPIYRDALESCEQLFGAEHPMTLTIARNLNILDDNAEAMARVVLKPGYFGEVGRGMIVFELLAA